MQIQGWVTTGARGRGSVARVTSTSGIAVAFVPTAGARRSSSETRPRGSKGAEGGGVGAEYSASVIAAGLCQPEANLPWDSTQIGRIRQERGRFEPSCGGRRLVLFASWIQLNE